MSGTPWTPQEIDDLVKLYPDHTAKAISIIINRSVPSIYGKSALLGLTKSAAFLASSASGRTDGKRGQSGRYKKGNVPANKGERRPGWAPGRMAETQFKKGEMSGQAQHNYVPIGSTRISKDGYLERKVTDDPALYPARRWVAVHRLVWEAIHGPIPDKHVVRFKIGMQTAIEDDITVNRLECISLADNMRRNTIHRYPKEIKDAVRSIAVLNRRINRVQEYQ